MMERQEAHWNTTGFSTAGKSEGEEEEREEEDNEETAEEEAGREEEDETGVGRDIKQTSKLDQSDKQRTNNNKQDTKGLGWRWRERE